MTTTEQTPPTSVETPQEEPKEPAISIDDFMKIDLRVGQIESCERVPKSKKLVKLAVFLGDSLGRRQILAGIGQHYEPEVLVGRRVIIVANLKPATLMGLESQGMVLAGASDDNAVLAIVEPASNLPLGTQVR